jgi:hypothetical protein
MFNEFKKLAEEHKIAVSALEQSIGFWNRIAAKRKLKQIEERISINRDVSSALHEERIKRT